ncbi:MAG: hypothetical protein RLY31_2736 [Bacteroidota bacterium]|jgi:hypothetical protein
MPGLLKFPMPNGGKRILVRSSGIEQIQRTSNGICQRVCMDLPIRSR